VGGNVNIQMLPDDTKSLISSLIKPAGLTDVGGWLAAQLRVVKYWSEHQESSLASQDDDSRQEASDRTIPERWEMTKGIELLPWQRECADIWFRSNRRGIAKVVTGAGKTIFAMHVIERLQRELDPDLRVAIVVPTIVLMDQWIDGLRRHSNLPPFSIGRLGGGYKDDLTGEHRILVCILNSAAKSLAHHVERSGQADHLLLIVDECHRARGKVMSQVFCCPRAFSLGLSATPEERDSTGREGQQTTKGDDSLEDVVLDNLGPIVYELTVKDAIDQGILSTFEIRHYGLQLEPKERQAYEKYSREIRNLEKTLRRATNRSKSGLWSSIFQVAQHLASKGKGEQRVAAERYILEIRRRKQLLYHACNRKRAVLELVRRTIEASPCARILVFHESIKEVMSLYLMLLRQGFRVAVDHSELPDSIRVDSIDLFRTGKAQILVSARTLIEGFDVPAADVGIIAASSTSARQRIQTIGRVLRKPADGTSKTAVIHSLYIAGTVDEMIFEKIDMERITGADRNSFFIWTPPPVEAQDDDRHKEVHRPVEQKGPPRQPKPTESDIDWSSLKPGDLYPGKYEGEEFRFDQQGNIFASDGRCVLNPQKVGDMVRDVCAGTTKFRITSSKRAILCWDHERNATKFVGYLNQEFQLGEAPPGQYRVRKVRGVRRILDDNGRYALFPEQASDPMRGEDAYRLVKAVGELEKETGRAIKKIEIDSLNKAYCIVDGQRQELCRLNVGLEFR